MRVFLPLRRQLRLCLCMLVVCGGVPAAIFLPDRSPHALDAVRDNCYACMRDACMSRSSPSHDGHILCARTHPLFGRLRAIANRKSALQRGSHMAPHFPGVTPCADRRHGEHDHVTDLLRSGSILVLYMCTKRVRRVELWTMHHASLTFTPYFFFLLHSSTQGRSCFASSTRTHSTPPGPRQPLFVCGSQRLL
jgi:hypothetical protein